jgi:hypothetical protein
MLTFGCDVILYGKLSFGFFLNVGYTERTLTGARTLVWVPVIFFMIYFLPFLLASNVL